VCECVKMNEKRVYVCNQVRWTRWAQWKISTTYSSKVIPEFSKICRNFGRNSTSKKFKSGFLHEYDDIHDEEIVYTWINDHRFSEEVQNLRNWNIQRLEFWRTVKLPPNWKHKKSSWDEHVKCVSRILSIKRQKIQNTHGINVHRKRTILEEF